MFTFVHGVFVMTLFGQDSHGFPNPFQANLSLSMYLAFACLFISHGVSFGCNYFYKGERNRTNLGKLMGQPYARIVVLHIAILFGAFLTMALGSPVGILLILVLLKTVMDVKLHLRERRKNETIVNVNIHHEGHEEQEGFKNNIN
jgi:hypothetical protein